MFVYCIFLTEYKGHESAQNNVEKPQKWMHTVSQGREYSLKRRPNSLQRESAESKDQLSNLSLLAAAKTRCPDLLEHETLGYKRGRNNHF